MIGACQRLHYDALTDIAQKRALFRAALGRVLYFEGELSRPLVDAVCRR